MADALEHPILHDETKAREWLEILVLPRRRRVRTVGMNVDEAKIGALQGKSHRAGLYQCAECHKQITVTAKTVFQRSKIQLSKWFWHFS